MMGEVENIGVFVPSRRFGSEMNNTSGTCVQYGVLVRDAIKTYGVGSRRTTILERLNMSVKKGSIYGLLGASGCGKTTLLSCLVGRRGLDSGTIQVMGHEPGAPESGIPGPRVGYMPQELALYGHFTIKETLVYFGRIYNLEKEFVESQVEFMSKLLDLPSSDRFVDTLSGGQQRRVSFAVALFHEPELLILDEPTVGVDPVLRHSIWKHLIRQSIYYGRTVIVTTHYIEEARQANTIGMMRSGRLLTEESPDNLLRNYNLSSLENVFLKLCTNDEAKNNIEQRTGTLTNAITGYNASRAQQPSLGNDNMAFDRNASQSDVNEIGIDLYTRNGNRSPTSLPEDLPVKKQFNSATSNSAGTTICSEVSVLAGKRSRNAIRTMLPSRHRLSAIILKNYLLIFRNLGILVFLYFLPALQAAIFNLTLGHEPRGLKVGIVNDELNVSQGRVCNYTNDCSYSMLSCRYLRFIKDNIIQVPFETVSEAIEAGKRNDVWGVIHFGHNFTEEFELRQNSGDSASIENIIRSRISVNMDSTNQQIDIFIEKWLIEGFGNFFKDFMISCEHEPDAGNIPLVFMDPVYGQKTTPYTEFMAPGLIISIIYFMAVSLTSGAFVAERKLGLLDRSLVAGVQMTEILMGYLVNQFTVMVGQIALVFMIMLLVFGIPCHGNLALGVFITFLQGLVGMSFGLLIATVCENEISALTLSMASFLPSVIMSGICWPIEGMPFYLQKISYGMPMTYAIESLRCIFSKGWGVDEFDVYAGIFTSIIWIFGLLIFGLIVVRFRNYST